MEKKIYLKDEEVKNFSTEEMKTEILDYIRKDIWAEPYIYECAMVPVPAGSKMFQSFNSEIQVVKNPDETVIVDPECVIATEEELDQAEMEKTMLFLYPLEGKMQVYPTRYTAFTSICQRAGLSGTTITNVDSKPAVDALPVIEKAHWLTRGMSLHKTHCKVLLRDGKISAMLSAEYEILPAYEAVPLLEKELSKEHPDYKFISGALSHEYLVLNYVLNDPVMEGSFKLLLENFGMNVNTLSAGVQFTTSDIGNSMVQAAPYYVVDGLKIRLGKPVGIRHDKGRKMGDFQSELRKLGMLFKEAEDQIEKLGNTDIFNPELCFSNIIDAHKTLKFGSDEVLEEIKTDYPAGTSCTAVDIFFYLNKIIEVRNSKKAMTPTQMINLSEEIAKFMYIDFKVYDK